MRLPLTQLSASPRIVHVRWKLFPDHVDHAALSASKVVDDGEAPDSNELDMGRRGSRVADGEVYEG